MRGVPKKTVPDHSKTSRPDGCAVFYHSRRIRRAPKLRGRWLFRTVLMCIYSRAVYLE